jgi:hypothetical protein
MGFEAQSLDSDSMLVLKPTYNNNNNNINSFYYSQYSNNIGFSTSGRRGHSCFFFLSLLSSVGRAWLFLPFFL